MSAVFLGLAEYSSVQLFGCAYTINRKAKFGHGVCTGSSITWLCKSVRTVC